MARIVRIVLSALALAAIFVPAASGGDRRVKEVNTRLSVDAVPTLRPETTTVTVTGDVDGRRGCARERKVRFAYSSLGVDQPLDVTVKTGRSGAFTAVLPRPTFQPGTRSANLTTRLNSVKRTSKGGLVRCDDARQVQPIRQSPPPRQPRSTP